MGSIAAAGIGVGLMGMGLVQYDLAQSALEKVNASENGYCKEAADLRLCVSSLADRKMARAWGYTGMGLLGGALVGGIITYAIKPKAKGPAFSVSLAPNRLLLQGRF